MPMHLASALPIDIPGLSSDIQSMSAGGYHVCGVTTAGALRCLGMGVYGELGNDLRVNSSTIVEPLGMSSGVLSVEAGRLHTCVLKAEGVVSCWGNLGGTMEAPESFPGLAGSNRPLEVEP